MSLILLCMVFFPSPSATELHPLPKPQPEDERQKRKQRRELEEATLSERNGWLYAAAVLAFCIGYAVIDAGTHTWVRTK